jgi:hypothetical protein
LLDDADPSYGVGTTEYMRSRSGYGVTLECGQHDDPAAPEVAYRAIRQAVALLGLADLPLAPPAARFERLQLTTVIARMLAVDRACGRPLRARVDQLRRGEGGRRDRPASRRHAGARGLRRPHRVSGRGGAAGA